MSAPTAQRSTRLDESRLAARATSPCASSIRRSTTRMRLPSPARHRWCGNSPWCRESILRARSRPRNMPLIAPGTASCSTAGVWGVALGRARAARPGQRRLAHPAAGGVYAAAVHGHWHRRVHGNAVHHRPRAPWSDARQRRYSGDGRGGRSGQRGGCAADPAWISGGGRRPDVRRRPNFSSAWARLRFWTERCSRARESRWPRSVGRAPSTSSAATPWPMCAPPCAIEASWRPAASPAAWIFPRPWRPSFCAASRSPESIA